MGVKTVFLRDVSIAVIYVFCLFQTSKIIYDEL